MVRFSSFKLLSFPVFALGGSVLNAAADADYLPVAKRPRAEVLVKGQDYLRPDLTRGIINDYRELLAWILQIKFTDAQADEFEQRMITRWPSLYKMDTDEFTAASKLNAEIRAAPAAQSHTQKASRTGAEEPA
jgi:hypothetical protein